MSDDKQYEIKSEHEAAISVSVSQAQLDPGKYHKVPGGVIVPQIKEETGGLMHGATGQEIPIVDVDMSGEEGVNSQQTTGILVDKKQEALPGQVTPSGLVAPVSQPVGPPPLKKPLIKVTLISPVFGKVILPVVEAVKGEECLVLVTDASDGFSFVPPESETAFTVSVPGQEQCLVLFCGQQFERSDTKEQYLVLVPVDK